MNYLKNALESIVNSINKYNIKNNKMDEQYDVEMEDVNIYNDCDNMDCDDFYDVDGLTDDYFMEECAEEIDIELFNSIQSLKSKAGKKFKKNKYININKNDYDKYIANKNLLKFNGLRIVKLAEYVTMDKTIKDKFVKYKCIFCEAELAETYIVCKKNKCMKSLIYFASRIY
jgi:hypothetical protein